MVRMGLMKKKESEAKALAIVERLIEPDINKEWFRDAVSDDLLLHAVIIWPFHYFISFFSISI